MTLALTSPDPPGDRMKGYEAATRLVLPARTFTAIRLDGRAFHSWTRGLDRPYDLRLVEVMGAVTTALCEQVAGAVIGYTQSDEISVVMQDFENERTQPWFGGSVQKIASVSASILTAEFARAWPDRKPACFDARVFTLPSRVEVYNYLLWRQADGRRNAISMLAQDRFSPKQLHGQGTAERRAMLEGAGVDIDAHDARFLHGQVAYRVTRVAPVEYVDKRTGETRTSPPVERRCWELDPAPSLTASHDGWLAERLPPEPSREAGV